MGEKEGVENPDRGKTTEISGNGKGFHGFPRRAVENSVENVEYYLYTESFFTEISNPLYSF